MQGDYHKFLPADMTVTKIGHPRCDSQGFENDQESEKELFRNIQGKQEMKQIL